MKVFFILITAGFLSACTSQQAWNTAQVIKDFDCDNNSHISYKRCDTRLEEEYQQAQEQKRNMEEEKKEQAIQAALERSNAQASKKKSERKTK